MAPEGPHLELVLARNLITTLVTPAFVVDPGGVMTFFNEAAGSLIGRRFDQRGRLSREDWNEIGPVDEQGRPAPAEKLPLTVALREGRPALGTFRIKTDDGALLEVHASAIPLCSAEGFCGALVTFVPVTPDQGPAPPSDTTPLSVQSAADPAAGSVASTVALTSPSGATGGGDR